MWKFGLQLARREREQVVCEFVGAEQPGLERDLGGGGSEGREPSVVRLIVTVMEIRGNRVTLAFKAPSSVWINRSELVCGDAATPEPFLLTLDSHSRLIEAANDGPVFSASSVRSA